MKDIAIEWITVTTPAGGHSRTLTTVVGLAEFLLRHCPDAKAAQQACVDALEGTIQPAEARAAFADAVAGARLFILDLKRPERRKPKRRR